MFGADSAGSVLANWVKYQTVGFMLLVSCLNILYSLIIFYSKTR